MRCMSWVSVNVETLSGRKAPRHGASRSCGIATRSASLVALSEAR